MKHKNYKSKLGAKVTTSEGYSCEIIEYIAWNNCKVLLDGNIIIENVRYESFNKGMIKNHLGEFSRMQLTKGPQFVPGEYDVEFTGRKMFFLNRKFKFLNDISFFKKLNTTYNFHFLENNSFKIFVPLPVAVIVKLAPSENISFIFLTFIKNC